MHGRDSHGIHAAAASVAKIPYRDAEDGISLTASMVPTGLGRVPEDRIDNLTSMLDAYFGSTGYHMNVNVLNRETLLDAVEHPHEKAREGDRLGRLSVTKAGLAERDRMVLEACRDRGIPVAVTMAGGYSRNDEETVAVHFPSIRRAADLLERSVGTDGRTRRP